MNPVFLYPCVLYVCIFHFDGIFPHMLESAIHLQLAAAQTVHWCTTDKKAMCFERRYTADNLVFSVRV